MPRCWSGTCAPPSCPSSRRVCAPAPTASCAATTGTGHSGGCPWGGRWPGGWAAPCPLPQDQRRSRLRQQEAADGHPARGVGVRGLRGERRGGPGAHHAGAPLHPHLPGDGGRLHERRLQPGALLRHEEQRLHAHPPGSGHGQHHAADAARPGPASLLHADAAGGVRPPGHEPLQRPGPERGAEPRAPQPLPGSCCQELRAAEERAGDAAPPGPGPARQTPRGGGSLRRQPPGAVWGLRAGAGAAVHLHSPEGAGDTAGQRQLRGGLPGAAVPAVLAGRGGGCGGGSRRGGGLPGDRGGCGDGGEGPEGPVTAGPPAGAAAGRRAGGRRAPRHPAAVQRGAPGRELGTGARGRGGHPGLLLPCPGHRPRHRQGPGGREGGQPRRQTASHVARRHAPGATHGELHHGGADVPVLRAGSPALPLRLRAVLHHLPVPGPGAEPPGAARLCQPLRVSGAGEHRAAGWRGGGAVVPAVGAVVRAGAPLAAGGFPPRGRASRPGDQAVLPGGGGAACRLGTGLAPRARHLHPLRRRAAAGPAEAGALGGAERTVHCHRRSPAPAGVLEVGVTVGCSLGCWGVRCAAGSVVVPLTIKCRVLLPGSSVGTPLVSPQRRAGSILAAG